MSRVLSVVAIALAAMISTASAQTQKSGIACENGMWNKLSDEEVTARGLSERRSSFFAAARSVFVGSAKIEDVVTDCPIYGYVRRTILLHGAVNMGSMSIPKTYGMYVTTAYLRNRPEIDDLIHDAREEACLIKTGIADRPQRGEGGEKDPSVRRCMLQEAVNAGETEYAKSLAARLGVAVPEKYSEIDSRAASIQRTIDKLDALKGRVPTEAIKKLEDLRDSFKK